MSFQATTQLFHVDFLAHQVLQAMDNKVETGQDTVEAHSVTHQVCDDNTTPVNEKFKVDTVHNDEALKVLASYHGDPTWDAEQEKEVRTKIDRRLLPILAITFGLQYYDKTMISQAVSLSFLFLKNSIND